ncbi:radical SAM protein [Lentzea sp. CA-135723]|uniref:radical SAM protein n=1 Tax=Lentzea sp. CA-135723 TaxID=3239950 RepID=UPI003D8A6265
MRSTSFLWLEITGRCQLTCTHCYADSGPTGTHGSMTVFDWIRVLDEATSAGVSSVQFIGGEPTLHPGLTGLVEHALAKNLRVEVFSNLVHVSDVQWEVFGRAGVSLATSYYSDDPGEHAQITGRSTHRQTRANVAEAVRRGIPLRAGVIDLRDGQRAEHAQAELVDLGVPSIGYDRLREVGRGGAGGTPDTSQLCGHCAQGVAAVSPDGAVWPCVFSRWLPMGNVLEQQLDEILAGPRARAIRAELAEDFSRNARSGQCYPDCSPSPCEPQCSPRCSPSCNPCTPSQRCWPSYR